MNAAPGDLESRGQLVLRERLSYFLPSSFRQCHTRPRTVRVTVQPEKPYSSQLGQRGDGNLGIAKDLRGGCSHHLIEALYPVIPRSTACAGCLRIPLSSTLSPRSQLPWNALYVSRHRLNASGSRLSTAASMFRSSPRTHHSCTRQVEDYR